jgi:hypothetical protein
MPSDKVERQLKQIIIPYLVSAEKLPRHTLYRTYNFFSFLQAYLAALVGFGIAPQVLIWYNKLIGGAPTKNEAASSTSGLGITAIILGAALVGLSVFYKAQKAPSRTILAKTCRLELLEIDTELDKVLQFSTPNDEIVNLQNKAVAIVNRYRGHDESWPWGKFADGIDDEVTQRVSALKTKFGPWKDAPEQEEISRTALQVTIPGVMRR